MNCNNKLVELDDGRIISWFCGNKLCPICNSLKLVKFLKKYLEPIKEEPIKYNAVLTARNPKEDNLVNQIDKMYTFFRNSGLKKNPIYRKLKKNIKMIRSFEVTFNKRSQSYNIHFHILIAGKNVKDVKLFGKILIKYWLKYFGKDANSKAQYLKKMRKSELENFKYLLKQNDVDNSNVHMLYNLLSAVHGRRLFGTMNIKGLKQDNNNQESIDGHKNLKENIKRLFYYSTEKETTTILTLRNFF